MQVSNKYSIKINFNTLIETDHNLDIKL